jgi:hypothetical protein
MKSHQPEQPILSEEEMIHALLAYVITEFPSDRLDELIDPAGVLAGINQGNFINLTMHRMVSEGLITSEKARYGRLKHVVKLTPEGIRIAHHTGGYLSYHAEQQNVVKQER